MGAKTAMSVEQYLATSFPDLDKEYRDGELEERSLPDYFHGRTQALLAALFLSLDARLRVFPTVETRVRLREGVFLIPDVAVFHPSEPGRVPDQPPLIAIEVLSEDDRLSRVLAKLEEYRVWGVSHVWLVDPHAKILYQFEGALAPVAMLRVPELGLEITPAEIFR